jgi:hypothetical protein
MFHNSVYCIELFIPCQPWIFIFFKIFCRFDLLFSSNTLRISTNCDSLWITSRTIFVDHPCFEKHGFFIFTWFVIAGTMCVDHSSLLGYYIQRLTLNLRWQQRRKKAPKSLGCFCYEVFPTLGSVQTANAAFAVRVLNFTPIPLIATSPFVFAFAFTLICF